MIKLWKYLSQKCNTVRSRKGSLYPIKIEWIHLLISKQFVKAILSNKPIAIGDVLRKSCRCEEWLSCSKSESEFYSFDFCTKFVQVNKNCVNFRNNGVKCWETGSLFIIPGSCIKNGEWWGSLSYWKAVLKMSWQIGMEGSEKWYLNTLS